MTYTTHLPDRHRNDPWKVPVRAATTANITIATALNNADVLDGVTLATGDRVLVKDQSTGSQNGVYVVGASPARAADFDTQGDILGAVVTVLEGTVNADTMWLCTTTATITVDTTALVFAAAGGGGAPAAHAASHENGGSDEIDVTGLVGASGSGYPEGTSFPGGPAADDKFYRTDRNLLYFYNGTRWLTVNLYSVPLGATVVLHPISATNFPLDAMVPHAGVYDLWLENFQVSFRVNGGTALSASHKWVLVLWSEPTSAALATATIDSGSLGVFRTSGPIAIGALIGTTKTWLYVAATKTGTPGTLSVTAALTCRMVG